MSKGIVVSLSGGMDSATLLAKAVNQSQNCNGNINISAVGFRYGSKHNPYEIAAARRVCKHFGVEFTLVNLSKVGKHLKSNLMATGAGIPEGHYEADNMSLTVVPGRNLIFASVLAGIAWSRGAGEVWMGIHSGDHAIYPDCRPDFYEAMKSAIELGSDGMVTLCAPFLDLNKTSIIQHGKLWGTPYEMTRTCYKDQKVACGKCGSCQERLEAFANCGMRDPIEYETRKILPKEEV